MLADVVKGTAHLLSVVWAAGQRCDVRYVRSRVMPIWGLAQLQSCFVALKSDSAKVLHLHSTASSRCT